ncbi:hypothetical protein [Archangium lansingense]|uniref:Lipoprotein n=1 Tax=Archangium lansingense TaxID=2995310 RepID=A0ABT4AD82_9BACT|nr:hypothetical protein [Archangium lansinium]MCY1078877.1 hypothetical protein [Archangium lansinium]
MSIPTLLRAVLALVLSLAACGPSRVEFFPLSDEPIQTAALSCPPAPAPVCPAAPVLECPPPPVCPAAPVLECPPPPVCAPPPEPPAPVELSFSATAIEPLRAELQVEWAVRGCTPSDVEILGEAGQVVSIYQREPVPVVNVSRPGAPMIERLGLWVRVTCDDTRSHVAGPFIVTDVLRATEIHELNTEQPQAVITRLLHMPEGVFLLWADRVAVNDPTITMERLMVLDASGQKLREHGLAYHTTGEGTAPTQPFWFEETRLVWSGSSGRRSFYDYTTGAGSPQPYRVTTPPPPAFTFPGKPDALRSWGGFWARHADGTQRAWVGRGSVVALVDLGG